MPQPDARFLVLALLLSAAGCGVVRSTWVRPDYQETDRTRVVRILVATAPLPEGSEDLGRLWTTIARRYVNQHRDFIARGEEGYAALPDDACGEGLEGVLHLVPTVRRAGSGVEAAVEARLLRCSDRELVWRAEAGGSWSAEDATVSEATEIYVGELGEGVRPYVPATFHLLRATLDTLPRPELPDDEAVMEKIELGE